MDLDAELMQKFSCLGTTDKDVLIGEFQRLLGFQLSPAGCAFFLDMTNWYTAGRNGTGWDQRLVVGEVGRAIAPLCFLGRAEWRGGKLTLPGPACSSEPLAPTREVIPLVERGREFVYGHTPVGEE